MVNAEKQSQLSKEEEIFEKALLSGDISQVRKCIASGLYTNFLLQDMPPLSIALQRGYFEIADFLIHKADVTMLDSSGKFSPMYYAIKHKCPVDLVRKIISAGFPKDGAVEYIQHKTALHLAVQYNAKSIIKGLLNLSVSVNAKDSEGLTPLHVAVLENHPGVVKLLKNADHNMGCANNFTPLLKAIHSNNLPLVKLLINQGSKLEYESKNTSLGCLNPLCYAAALGLTEIVEELLSSGASPNFTTSSGNNSLHMLALHANSFILNMEQVKATVRLLHKSNINFELRNKKGLTPLQSAVVAQNEIVAETLIEMGSECNNRSQFGSNTPLHMASRIGDHSTVCSLLMNGADSYAENSAGLTPYDVALMQDDLSTVQTFWKFHHPFDESNIISGKQNDLRYVSVASNNLLCQQHKFINSIITGDLTSLSCALDNGAISGGCALQLLNPLHSSISKGDINIALALLDSGVKIGHVNRFGETVLHSALRSGCIDLFKLLLRYGACYNPSYNSSYKNYPRTPIEIAYELRQSDVHAMLQKVDQAFILVGQGDYRGFELLFDKYWCNQSAEVVLNAVDGKGQTLMSIAIHNKNKKLVELIMKYRLNFQ